jgi:hypothetical protein
MQKAYKFDSAGRGGFKKARVLMEAESNVRMEKMGNVEKEYKGFCWRGYIG